MSVGNHQYFHRYLQPLVNHRDLFFFPSVRTVEFSKLLQMTRKDKTNSAFIMKLLISDKNKLRYVLSVVDKSPKVR